MLSSTIIFYSCQKDSNSEKAKEKINLSSKLSQVEKDMVISFINSKEFKRETETSLSKFGKIDFLKTTIEYVEGNKQKPILNFSYFNGNFESALLQVVSIPDKFDEVLPNNDKYAMMLIDYRKFDYNSNTGSYAFIDLNYDDSKAIEAKMENGKITGVSNFDLPSSVKQKYTTLKTKRDLGNPIFSNNGNAQRQHFCDQNGNGNVSYFECLGCGISACGNNYECAGLCGGIELVKPGYCIGSMAAACVYIAAVY